MLKIYIIDNNSIRVLAKYYWNVIGGIKEKFENLIKERRLISSIKVFEELKLENKEGFSWAKEHKKIFSPISKTQFKILTNIIKNHPDLYSFFYPTGKHEKYADPFLISLGIEKMKEKTLAEKRVFVVTEETKEEERLKIPLICDKLGLNSINLQEVFKEEGWELMIK
jgi:hypothetical protein